MPVEVTKNKYMSREIKFRGISSVTGVFIYGDYNFIDGSYYIFPRSPDAADSPDNYLVKPETIGQYTGVNDKNNKESYESDIIHCFIDGIRIGDNDDIGFKNGSFWLNRRDIPISQWYDMEGSEFEIVGNIYQPINQ